MNKNLNLLSLALVLSITTVFAQSKALKPLYGEGSSTTLSLYFYPSTLRMINLEKDPAFYEMIKEVKGLRFFTIDSSKLSLTTFKKVKSQLVEEEYEELISMKSNQGHVTLLAKYKNDDMIGMVALIKQETAYMFAELIGKIDPTKAIDMAQNGVSLKMLEDFMDNSDKEKQARDEFKRRQEEKKAIRDSLDNQSKPELKQL